MIYNIHNNKLSVDIDTVGAEIKNVISDSYNYLWNGDATYWNQTAPVLFPYIGRFTNGKYLYKGKEYSMKIHGFISDVEFEIEDKKDESITLLFSDNEETYAQYPFHFELRVTYTLCENRLNVTYNVINLSDDTMFYGIGAHPGFNVPMGEELDFSDYYLEFDEKCVPTFAGQTPDCFLNGIDEVKEIKDGRIIEMSHNMFDDDALCLYNMDTAITLKSDKSSRSVRVVYPDMRYLGLWHAPKTEAPYICIEPWTSLQSRSGIVENISAKSDLIRLKPGNTYENNWYIEVN